MVYVRWVGSESGSRCDKLPKNVGPSLIPVPRSRRTGGRWLSKWNVLSSNGKSCVAYQPENRENLLLVRSDLMRLFAPMMSSILTILYDTLLLHLIKKWIWGRIHPNPRRMMLHVSRASSREMDNSIGIYCWRFGLHYEDHSTRGSPFIEGTFVRCNAFSIVAEFLESGCYGRPQKDMSVQDYGLRSEYQI